MNAVLFNLGDYFGKPLHAGIIGLDRAKRYVGCIRKTKAYAEAFFHIAVGIPTALASLLFSSLGALVIACSHKKCLVSSFQVAPSEILHSTSKILSYNIGLLPGLGMKTAQHDPSCKEQIYARIANFLIRQFEHHDLIVLQEAVAREFILFLEKMLKRENIPFVLYFRIGDPLHPGISSGKCHTC